MRSIPIPLARRVEREIERAQLPCDPWDTLDLFLFFCPLPRRGIMRGKAGEGRETGR